MEADSDNGLGSEQERESQYYWPDFRPDGAYREKGESRADPTGTNEMEVEA